MNIVGQSKRSPRFKICGPYFDSDDQSHLERPVVMTWILRILLTLKLVTFTSQ